MGVEDGLPYVGMVMAECAQVGLMILSKEAMSTGMSTLVFITFSNALASLVLLPSAFLFHRSQRPPLTFSLLAVFFLLGLFGSGGQIFGMEKLDWRKLACVAKSVGTVVSVVGAFIVTLYQGPPLLAAPSPIDLKHLNLITQHSKWMIGGLLLTADCVMTSGWLILQASILKRYPAQLIVVFFYCFFVAIQCGVVTLIVERDLSAWSLKPTVKLIAVLYSAVFGSAFQVGVSSWCLRKKGPVFVSMFRPLGIAISMAFGVIFFGDTFYLGSLIGICVIVVGFYSVMWGKANEEKLAKPTGLSSLLSTNQKTPLLENNIEEI